MTKTKRRVSARSKQQDRKPSSLRITLAMIVKNEAEFLPGCLETAKPYVDEVIVVDTGSTDETKEIARRYGAKVVDHEWKNDFAEARNVSLEHATGEWILWLDADERLHEHSGEVMRDVVHRNDVGGYIGTIRNYQDAEGHRIFVHHACRLFRRLPGVRFEQKIHEQILEQILQRGYKSETADIVIDHYGYIPELFRTKGKDKRNAEILEAVLTEEPGNYYLMFKQASAHAGQQRYVEAVEMFKHVEDLGFGSKIGSALYYEWADSLTCINRPDEALAVCELAHKMGLRHPALCFVHGRALAVLKRYPEAITQYELAIKLGAEMPNAAGDTGTWGFKAYGSMADAYAKSGDWDKVRECATKCLELEPNDVRALGLLAAALRVKGHTEGCMQTLERVITIAPNMMQVHYDLAQLTVESGDYMRARMYLEKLVQLCPEQVQPHLWLGATYEELSMNEQALEEYRRVMEIDPSNALALNNMACIYRQSKEYQDAVDCITQAIDIQPDWANAYFNAGDILYDVGALADARGAYEHALRLDPTNAVGFLMLGNCYFKQGVHEAAEVAYRQALKIQPDYPEAENNLKFTLSYVEERDRGAGNTKKPKRAA